MRVRSRGGRPVTCGWGMIETFVTMRLKDADDWFKRVPQYQRQNTNPIERQRYLDQICEIVQLAENRSN
jgi:hypothetical protein